MNRKLLLFAWLLSSGFLLAEEERPWVVLHKRGDFQCHTFRIPALARTPSGVLLAVFDMRYKSRRDLQGHMDIGLSRSTDGGKSWGISQADHGYGAIWRPSRRPQRVLGSKYSRGWRKWRDFCFGIVDPWQAEYTSMAGQGVRAGSGNRGLLAVHGCPIHR